MRWLSTHRPCITIRVAARFRHGPDPVFAIVWNGPDGIGEHTRSTGFMGLANPEAVGDGVVEAAIDRIRLAIANQQDHGYILVGTKHRRRSTNWRSRGTCQRTLLLGKSMNDGKSSSQYQGLERWYKLSPKVGTLPYETRRALHDLETPMRGVVLQNVACIRQERQP